MFVREATPAELSAVQAGIAGAVNALNTLVASGDEEHNKVVDCLFLLEEVHALVEEQLHPPPEPPPAPVEPAIE